MQTSTIGECPLQIFGIDIEEIIAQHRMVDVYCVLQTTSHGSITECERRQLQSIVAVVFECSLNTQFGGKSARKYVARVDGLIERMRAGCGVDIGRQLDILGFAASEYAVLREACEMLAKGGPRGSQARTRELIQSVLDVLERMLPSRIDVEVGSVLMPTFVSRVGTLCHELRRDLGIEGTGAVASESD